MLGLSLSHIALIVAIVLLIRQGRWKGMMDGFRLFRKNFRDEKNEIRDAEYRKLDQ